MALQNLNIDPFDNNAVYEANSNSESLTIPAAANYPYNATVKDRYVLQLQYIPYIADGYDFAISGYTRWESGTFIAGQFKVIAFQDSPDNLSNLVEFHPDDAGDSITIDYFHIGTQLSKEILEATFEAKNNCLVKSQNLDDLANKSTARTNLDVYSKSEDATQIESWVETYRGKRYTKTLTGGSSAIEIASLNTSVLRYKFHAEILEANVGNAEIDIQVYTGSAYVTNNYIDQQLKSTSTTTASTTSTSGKVGYIYKNRMVKISGTISIINSQLTIECISTSYDGTNIIKDVLSVINTGTIANFSKVKLLTSGSPNFKEGSKFTLEEVVDGKAV